MKRFLLAATAALALLALASQANATHFGIYGGRFGVSYGTYGLATPFVPTTTAYGYTFGAPACGAYIPPPAPAPVQAPLTAPVCPAATTTYQAPVAVSIPTYGSFGVGLGGYGYNGFRTFGANVYAGNFARFGGFRFHRFGGFRRGFGGNRVFVGAPGVNVGVGRGFGGFRRGVGVSVGGFGGRAVNVNVGRRGFFGLRRGVSVNVR